MPATSCRIIIMSWEFVSSWCFESSRLCCVVGAHKKIFRKYFVKSWFESRILFIFASENHVRNFLDNRYRYGSPQRKVETDSHVECPDIGDHIYMIKAFIWRFVLDLSKFSQSFITVKVHSNDRCSWVCIHQAKGIPYLYIRYADGVLYIQAWASALLVPTVIGNARSLDEWDG